MITNLREMAQRSNIHIVYDKLPKGMPGVCAKRNNIKLMIINKDIRDTDSEVEEIALNLGYFHAMEILDIKVNVFNKENEEDYKKLTEVAKEFKDTLLLKLILQKFQEFLSGKTEEEKEELIQLIVKHKIEEKELIYEIAKRDQLKRNGYNG